MPTDHPQVAASNRDQAAAWDGDEGALWARHHDFFESAVRAHQDAMTAAAGIGADEQVLDLGCGTGGSTVAAARAAHLGGALGIDLSTAMLATAADRAAAQGVRNVEFVHGDAQVWPFRPASFDVAISRTGSSFFADPVAAFANVAAALRPGGRLALVSWRGPEHNEWFRSFVDALTLGQGLAAPPPPGAPGPFAHADPARVREILAAAGFTRVRCEAIDPPMRFGATVAEAHSVLSRQLGWLTGHVDASQRERAAESLRTTLQQHLTADGVVFGSAAWVITAALP
jgi:SAM-dependent methyltransferase